MLPNLIRNLVCGVGGLGRGSSVEVQAKMVKMDPRQYRTGQTVHRVVRSCIVIRSCST